MSKKVLSFILLILLPLALFVVGYYVAWYFMSIAPQENAVRVKRTVEAVCGYSRDRVSGELEEVCGIAQDTSDTVYLCPKGPDGSHGAPTSQCWVEDKR